MNKLQFLRLMLLSGTIAISRLSGAQSPDGEEEATARDRAEIDEIIVTAARRAQSLQDVPMSVSAVTGSSLNELGARELDDYFGFMPSVNSASNTIGERGGKNIIIRGISNTRIASAPSALTATTGYYINDIPITPVDTELFDVDRVEVLRGPQGTLYGAAALGGATRLFLKRPNLTKLEGAVEGSFHGIKGGDPGGDISAMLNMPVFEGVFGLRFVGSYRARDGFIDTALIPLENTSGRLPAVVNPTLDVRPPPDAPRWEASANSQTAKGATVSALYTPTDRLNLALTYLWQDTEYDDLNFVNKRFGGEYLQEKYLLEPGASEATLTALNVSYDFGGVTLVSNSAYYTREYDEIIDWTQVAYQGGYSTVLDYIPAAATQDSQMDLRTVTQELRLESDRSEFSGFLGRVDWAIGAFFLREDRSIDQVQWAPGWAAAAPNNPLPVANDVIQISMERYRDESKAAFLDATYHITDRLAVGAGIRFFDLSTRFRSLDLNRTNPIVPAPESGDFSENGKSVRFSVSYDLSDSHKVFANFADGFRLGGVGSPINLNTSPLCVPVLQQYGLERFADGRFKSDSVETYEIGVKSAIAGKRATLNVSVYHTDWTDLQQQVRLGDLSTTCFATLTANIGTSEVDGVEVELAALATDNFLLQASLAYTDAVVVDPGPGGLSKRGDRILNVPEWSGAMIARYETRANVINGGTFFIQGDLRYVGEREPSTGNTNPLLTLDDNTLLGLRMGVIYGDERPTTITLWAKNLLNDDVDQNSRNRIGIPDIVVNRGLPRTFGITVRKDF